jgi:hypothetical protein
MVARYAAVPDEAEVIRLRGLPAVAQERTGLGRVLSIK